MPYIAVIFSVRAFPLDAKYHGDKPVLSPLAAFTCNNATEMRVSCSATGWYETSVCNVIPGSSALSVVVCSRHIGRNL